MVVTATVYRTIWTSAAGYVTALLAPTPKMSWVIILAIVVFTLNLVGIAINLKYKLSPNWYPISLVLLAIPGTWLGGKLHEMQQ